MRSWLSDLIAFCRYERTVCLLRSTKPDVQYAIASLANLTASFCCPVTATDPYWFFWYELGVYMKYSVKPGNSASRGFAPSKPGRLLFAYCIAFAPPFFFCSLTYLILSASIYLSSLIPSSGLSKSITLW